jgi:hypothetical protein
MTRCFERGWVKVIHNREQGAGDREVLHDYMYTS